MGTTLAILGIASGIGGGIAGAQGSRGPRSRDLIDADFFGGDLGGDLSTDILGLEVALALGADPDAIVEDFIFNELENSGSVGLARNVRNMIATARNQLQRGFTQSAENFLASANASISGSGSRTVAAPATFRIENGQIVAEVSDPTLNGIISSARENSEAIRAARTASINQLATGANIQEREQEAERFLQLALEENLGRLRAREEERANLLGTAPRTQDLNRMALLLGQQISSGGALERALALIRGEQDVLSTSLLPPLLPALQRAQELGVQANAGNLAAGLELSRQQADAENRRAQGLAASFGGLGGVLTSPQLSSLLGANTTTQFSGISGDPLGPGPK